MIESISIDCQREVGTWATSHCLTVSQGFIPDDMSIHVYFNHSPDDEIISKEGLLRFLEVIKDACGDNYSALESYSASLMSEWVRDEFVRTYHMTALTPLSKGRFVPKKHAVPIIDSRLPSRVTDYGSVTREISADNRLLAKVLSRTSLVLLKCLETGEMF